MVVAARRGSTGPASFVAVSTGLRSTVLGAVGLVS
jgi:hypothetical protein